MGMEGINSTGIALTCAYRNEKIGRLMLVSIFVVLWGVLGMLPFLSLLILNFV